MLSSNKIRTTFIISLLVHCLLLCVLGFNLPPLELDKAENTVIRIEIEKPALLPRTDIVGKEKKLKEVTKEQKQPNRRSESKPETKDEAKSEEIVVEELSKESTEEKIEVPNPARETILSYREIVKQRIEEARRYPSWAKKRGIEGVTCLSFTVLSNGLSQDIKIIRLSGSKILDEEAISTIKRANPFPPIPKELRLDSIQMEISIVFALQPVSA